MSVFQNLACLSLVVWSIFSKFCASKSGVRLIYGCGLYTDVYGNKFYISSFWSDIFTNLNITSTIQLLYLPVYNAHFFSTEKAPKIEMRIILYMESFVLDSRPSLAYVNKDTKFDQTQSLAFNFEWYCRAMILLILNRNRECA